jgi:flagellar biosynthesis anti-sigma factor FlgM
MKIENNNINGASLNKAEGAHQIEKPQSAAVDNASSVTKKDKAELSDQARLLSKARIALDGTSEVNQAKVDDLKAKIQKGEYNVPYDQLANNMMSKLGLN